MSEQFDDRGKVALWKPQSDNPKAPAAKGTVVAHRDIREGEEVEIALWRFTSDNPNAPLMKGKISDKRQQQAPQQPRPVQHPADDVPPFDDSVPF